MEGTDSVLSTENLIVTFGLLIQGGKMYRVEDLRRLERKLKEGMHMFPVYENQYLVANSDKELLECREAIEEYVYCQDLSLCTYLGKDNFQVLQGW